MSTRSTSRQFNIAPGAARHAPWVWLMLVTSAVFAAASFVPLMLELDALQNAKDAQSMLSRSIKRTADDERRRRSDQSSAFTADRSKELVQLKELAFMSWDGVFDALESAAQAVHSGVSITSLAPTTVQADAVRIKVTALATNVPIMLAYIETLKKDPRVVEVEVSTQQPDDKAGPGVIRFQASLLMNPAVDVPHPVRPAYVPASTDASKVGAIMPPAVLDAARNSPPAVPKR